MLKNSNTLIERARKVAPGGVHSPVRAFKNVECSPVFMKSAKGVTLTDVDDNTYLDFCMSWGPMLLGHQDEDVKAAVMDALGRGWTFGTAETVSLELAELLVEQLPFIDQVRFVNSGTEAVMAALRLARGFTGRDKIIKFDGCYHGHVDSMLVKSGSGLADMASPDSAGVSLSQATDTIVCPLDDEEACIHAMERHHPAAVIIEPLPANYGLLLQRREFVEKITFEAKKRGILVIFDEVISGFRLSFGGYAQREELYPDIVTYGKIIGGGFPVGAFAARKKIMAMLAPLGPVYQAGTLSANPIAMTAGLATVKKLIKNNPYPCLSEMTMNLVDEFNIRIGEKYPLKMCGRDSVFWVVCHDGQEKPQGTIRSLHCIPFAQKTAFGHLYPKLLKEGVYLAPSGFEVGFLSTAHTVADTEKLLSAFEKALKSA